MASAAAERMADELLQQDAKDNPPPLDLINPAAASDNNPKFRFRVTRGSKINDVEARDHNEAWQRFCDFNCAWHPERSGKVELFQADGSLKLVYPAVAESSLPQPPAVNIPTTIEPPLTLGEAQSLLGEMLPRLIAGAIGKTEAPVSRR
jgi:hypothetical protein